MPLAAANGQPIEVYINSGGGYVHAGADIYTALCEYPGEVNIKIIYAAQRCQRHCNGRAQHDFSRGSDDDS